MCTNREPNFFGSGWNFQGIKIMDDERALASSKCRRTKSALAMVVHHTLQTDLKRTKDFTGRRTRISNCSTSSGIMLPPPTSGATGQRRLEIGWFIYRSLLILTAFNLLYPDSFIYSSLLIPTAFKSALSRLVHIFVLINPDCLQSALSRLVHIFVLINSDCLQSALSRPYIFKILFCHQSTAFPSESIQQRLIRRRRSIQPWLYPANAQRPRSD